MKSVFGWFVVGLVCYMCRLGVWFVVFMVAIIGVDKKAKITCVR